MSDASIPQECDVAIVGSGPAGLALAAELKRQGVRRVVVLERESTAGGVPRHCGHYPFGLREYHRLLTGPDYARKNLEIATDLGADIYTDTTVCALHPQGRLSLSTPLGDAQIKAKRVVLCTGVRESSRAQRFIGGDRPLGVMTTGALQSMVYLHGLSPFRRPVILGTELVSFSAINTCRHLDIHPVAMIEENHCITTYPVVKPYPLLRGVPLYLNATGLRILGGARVEAVAFTDATRTDRQIEADGVIVTGKFRPEATLLRSSHLEMDSGTAGPVIDQYGQCSDPSYYATGNLLRPAETSGQCWREGVAAARRIADDLARQDDAPVPSVALRADDPAIGFVVPQRLSITDRPGAMTKMQIGLHTALKADLGATSNGKLIWQGRINSRPVRRIHLPLTPILQTVPEAQVTLSSLKEG